MEIDEKNLKIIFKTKSDEIMRHFDKLMMDLKSEIRLIIEQLNYADKK